MSQTFLQFDEPVSGTVALPPSVGPQPGKLWGLLTPRPYQRKAHDRALELLESNPGAIIRLATGLGKTPTACMVIASWLAMSPLHRVLVSIHEKKLVRQFSDEVRDFLGIHCAIEMAEEHAPARNMPDVIVSSRQSLISVKRSMGPDGESIETRRLEKFNPRQHCWLLLMDECHRWTYGMNACRPIIDHFEKNAFDVSLLEKYDIDPSTIIAGHRRLGTTATPERTDGISPARLFPGCAIDIPYCEAVDMGYLVPYRQKYITVEGVDFSVLKDLTKQSDIDRTFEQMMLERETMVSLVVPTVEAVGDRRTIVFCPGKQAAAEIAAMIRAEWPDKGAESVDGDSPVEIREDVFRRHQSDEFQFLCVCGLCREGYNDPSLGAVAILRPTKSGPLAEQMKGRGCRTLRGLGLENMETAEERKAAIAASAKPTCLIIDMVGATGLGDTASTAYMLANGLPDVVVERANQRMLERAKDGEEFDPVEELARAEEDVERERIAREEQRRLLDAEAKRRAELEAKVHYTEHDVRPGDVAPHGRAQEYTEARMPWGKHKGKRVADLPGGYLRAMADKPCNQKYMWVKLAMQKELDRREGRVQPQSGQARSTSIVDINRMLLER